jgi:hypothetical protein
MLARACVLAVLATAGCSSSADRSPARGDTSPIVKTVAPSTDIDSLAAMANPALQLRAAALSRERDSIGLLLMFDGRGDNPPRNRSEFTFEDAPCGYTITGRFRRIPRPDSLFAPVPAVEFDSTGKTLRSWRLPTVYSVLGIQGDEIIAGQTWGPDSGRAILLAIDTSGHFRALPRVPLITGTGMSCPKTLELGESAYRFCVAFIDPHDRSRHRLALEGQCS